MQTEDILKQRGTTHGVYTKTAEISQQLKYIIGVSPSSSKLLPDQVETLEMIMHKIARILSGNPEFADHWDDIAGYAKLSANAIRERELAPKKELERRANVVSANSPETSGKVTLSKEAVAKDFMEFRK